MFPHVSTESLVCALFVSEERSLKRTAKRLHTTTSNVSRKIKALQTSWNIEFFRRTMSGFELTEVGCAVMPEVRKALEDLQRAFDRAVYTAVRRRWPFLIGYSLYAHGRVLPFLQRQNPPSGFSRIAVKADTTMHLKRRVLRGEIVVGFGVMPIEDKDLLIEPIAQEGFGVCIPDTHPLKDRVRLSAHDLAGETLYWMPRLLHPAFYDRVKDYLLAVGFDPRNIREARAIIQGIDMAANKFGVALVPQSADRFRTPGVLFKPLTDTSIGIETALFARRDRMRGEIKDFVDAALAELKPKKTDLR